LHGQGQDVLNVSRTRQRLDIDGATGVTLGSPTLGLVNIAGSVHIGAGGPTTLTVDDTASTTTRHFGLSRTAIAGLTPQSIDFANASIRSLNMRCGHGSSTVDVLGTPAGATTSLELGSGTDHVNVKGSQDLLAIGAIGGTGHSVVVGSSAPDVTKAELAPILGPLRIDSGGERIDLVVSDGGGHVPRSGELVGNGISELGPASIAFGRLHSLDVRLSPAGNRLLVRGTVAGGATTVHTGGRDTIDVKPTRDAACELLVQGPDQSRDSLQVVAADALRP